MDWGWGERTAGTDDQVYPAIIRHSGYKQYCTNSRVQKPAYISIISIGKIPRMLVFNLETNPTLPARKISLVYSHTKSEKAPVPHILNKMGVLFLTSLQSR